MQSVGDIIIFPMEPLPVESDKFRFSAGCISMCRLLSGWVRGEINNPRHPLLTFGVVCVCSDAKSNVSYCFALFRG